MAQVIVTSESAVFLDSATYPDLRETLQTMVVQNLGPDDLYLDYVSDLEDLSSDTGIKLVANAIWEIHGYDSGRPIAMISTGTSDIRTLAFD